MDGEVAFEFVLFWSRIGWQIACLVVLALFDIFLAWLIWR